VRNDNESGIYMSALKPEITGKRFETRKKEQPTENQNNANTEI